MIARMKVSVLPALGLLVFFAASAFSPPLEAKADTLRYAVAADDNVWFYASENEDGRLFLIPESYYVRVLSEGESFTAVEYLVNDPPYRKVVGYCETTALTFVDFIPARPFLKMELTVSYTLRNGGADFGDRPVFSEIERSYVYYGMRYEAGVPYAYVLYEGSFGYIPVEAEPVFEKNDDYLSVPVSPSEGASPAKKGGLNAAQIAVICVVCVAAVAAAVFILRGRRRASPSGEDKTEF